MNRTEVSKVFILLVIFSLSVLRYFSFTDPISNFLTEATNPVSEYIYETVALNGNPSVALPASQLVISDNEAKVIKKEIAGLERNILINKGSSHGLSAGDPVTKDGYLVGSVINLGDEWARIRLITDPKFRAGANTENSRGIIKNETGSIVYDLVDNDKLAGETILTSGIDGNYPPGIAIGQTAERVDGGDTTFARYNVLLGVNPLELNSVEISR